jgi:uncharacterized protein YjbI with pentapeptide repeats/energy-coupling factor transporter ATP-binding protein EcfA2
MSIRVGWRAVVSRPEILAGPVDDLSGADDVRRWPWLAACAGWLGGGASAAVASGGGGLGPSWIFGCGTLGAFSGALAALAWVSWIGRARGTSSGRADLWDAWLDEGGRAEAVEGVGEVSPARAAVRPRVFTPAGESFCLEDEVYPFAKNGGRGAIRLLGTAGSGKSTALRHLLATLPPELGVRVLDDPDGETLAALAGEGLVVYAPNESDRRARELLEALEAFAARFETTDASNELAVRQQKVLEAFDAISATAYASRWPDGMKLLATFTLAPWGEDELIEYLLAMAAGRCGSVMARLKVSDEWDLPEGNPEIWRVVLDRMIADESVGGVRQALERDLASRTIDETFRERVRVHCLDMMGVPVGSPPSAEEREGWSSIEPTLAGLIRHRIVQLLVTADQVAADLGDSPANLTFLTAQLPVDLVREAGRLIREAPASLARLAAFVDADHRTYSPMAASLLHASATGWRPTHGSAPRLSGAYLDRVEWPCIALPSVEMEGVGLVGACLVRATLDWARLKRARLGGAKLGGASLEGVEADGANLSHADLSSARAGGASFRQANLKRANLASASLRVAWFQQADLTDACLKGADLTRASFEDATIDGANFTDATLESADLRSLKLTRATFTGATFAAANLSGADLEGINLPGANFAAAQLRDALLTGSVMPSANFRKADLRGAGLAEVEWEGANLAGADLRGASFHMGSSRSGLVNSPIASEGSRTGFYTDDFDEQDFKSPEEIRKANLRGADLRGANIEGVDFYLVDLRDALLDKDQRDHLRRCGAILRSRGA